MSPQKHVPQVPSAPQRCVLLKHGEVFLRGRNRDVYEERLHDNLRRTLKDVEGSTWIRRGQSVTVLGGEPPLEELVERARRVMGFNVVQPAIRVASELEVILSAAVDALSTVQAERGDVSFAVRVRRRDKGFALKSSELEVRTGAEVHGRLGLPVNLSAPDVRLSIEVERKGTYLSWARHAGAGGLPVGSSGRALVLLSGGYDSPVAAHRAMRRGLRCDFVHFTGAPYTSAASAYKAYALARELNRWQPAGRLHIIALGQAQKQLAVAGAGKLQVVAQRRLMVRTAGALARRTGASALVTGDCLGQVASQTLTNMATVDEAAQLPVLRPLLAWEKQEIIDEARSIGTAEVSVLPDEDCCSLLAPERIAISSQVSDLEKIEKRLDSDSVVFELLRGAQRLRPGQEESDERSRTPLGEPEESTSCDLAVS